MLSNKLEVVLDSSIWKIEKDDTHIFVYWKKVLVWKCEYDSSTDVV